MSGTSPTWSNRICLYLCQDIEWCGPYKLNAAKEITHFRVKASTVICKYISENTKGKEGIDQDRAA